MGIFRRKKQKELSPERIKEKEFRAKMDLATSPVALSTIHREMEFFYGDKFYETKPGLYFHYQKINEKMNRDLEAFGKVILTPYQQAKQDYDDSIALLRTYENGQAEAIEKRKDYTYNAAEIKEAEDKLKQAKKRLASFEKNNN